MPPRIKPAAGTLPAKWYATSWTASTPTSSTQPEAAALGLKAISHVHVRARWAGRCLVVEVEGFVPPATTVEDGEAMRQEVTEAVLAAVPTARAVQWYPRAAPSPRSD